MKIAYKKDNYYKTLWGKFDKDNSKHRYILSLCIQYGWTTENPKTGNEIADIIALTRWLHSARCPVRKPLRKMTSKELSQVITALESMITKRFKK